MYDLLCNHVVEWSNLLGNCIFPALAGVQGAGGVWSAIFVHQLHVHSAIPVLGTIHLEKVECILLLCTIIITFWYTP